MSKKNKKQKDKLEVKLTPIFDFAVDGNISSKQADRLLDIICCYLDGIDCTFVGGMRLLTPEELEAESKKIEQELEEM